MTEDTGMIDVPAVHPKLAALLNSLKATERFLAEEIEAVYGNDPNKPLYQSVMEAKREEFIGRIRRFLERN
jgi:hypothetical protein